MRIKKAAHGEIEIANGILKAKCFIDQECEIINEEQLNGGWIPASERLPKEETGCLVWQKIDGHYKYNIWHYVTDFPSSVIAWQPLPEHIRR